MNNRKNQRGFTLGEVLGAIIIGSIIFGAVALVISNAIETSRVSNQQENLSYLRMNIHEVYSHVHSFASISNDELLAANAVPQGMVVNDFHRQRLERRRDGRQCRRRKSLHHPTRQHPGKRLHQARSPA